MIWMVFVMNNLIYQFYNEGLATTFYLKPRKWLKKRINNKCFKIMDFILKFLYTIFVLLFAWIVFWEKFPL